MVEIVKWGVIGAISIAGAVAIGRAAVAAFGPIYRDVRSSFKQRGWGLMQLILIVLFPLIAIIWFLAEDGKSRRDPSSGGASGISDPDPTL